jgi:hypothetical protein
VLIRLCLQVDSGGAGQLRKPNAPKSTDGETNLFDLAGASFDDNGLQTVIVVEVNMGTAKNVHVPAMLGFEDFLSQIPLMVIVADS